jgi:hypothetical protein
MRTMVGIMDPPTTLHPSPSFPLIPVLPFLTPFLVSVFWLRPRRAGPFDYFRTALL